MSKSKKETSNLAMVQSLMAETQKTAGSYNADNALKVQELEVGDSISVRIIQDPDTTNPLVVAVSQPTHWVNRRRFNCIGHNCPICDGKDIAYREGRPEVGKQLLVKRNLLMQVIITKAPKYFADKVGKVLQLTLTPQLVERWNAGISELLELDDPTIDPWSTTDGYDFRISVSQSGEFRKYDGVFARKSTSLSTEEIALAESAAPLSELTDDNQSVEFLQSTVDAYLRSEGVLAAVPFVSESSESEYEEGSEAILAKIKSRLAK